jgi:hypothetical protein
MALANGHQARLSPFGGKSVAKHDRRDAQRAQDQLRKNTNAVSGTIKKRDLFPGAGF